MPGGLCPAGGGDADPSRRNRRCAEDGLLLETGRVHRDYGNSLPASLLPGLPWPDGTVACRSAVPAQAPADAMLARWWLPEHALVFPGQTRPTSSWVAAKCPAMAAVDACAACPTTSGGRWHDHRQHLSAKKRHRIVEHRQLSAKGIFNVHTG